MCFSVSLICLCFCAVAALGLGSNRARARSAENNAPENPRRVGMAFSLRMSGIAYSFIASDWRNVLSTVALHFAGRALNGTRFQGLGPFGLTGSLAGWLLGLIAMRWP